MVLTTEERAFLVRHVFQEGGRKIDMVQQIFAYIFSDTPILHRNIVCNLFDNFRKHDQ